MRIWTAIAAAVLAAVSAPVLAEQPEVGDLFDAPPSVQEGAFEWKFRGWQYAGRGEALGMGRFVLFSKGNSILIAATEVISPSRSFGHDGVQKIVAVKLVAPVAGEKQAVSCDFMTLTPAVAFYAGNIARGYFVLGSEIIEKRWFADGDCYDNPD